MYFFLQHKTFDFQHDFLDHPFQLATFSSQNMNFLQLRSRLKWGKKEEYKKAYTYAKYVRFLAEQS